MTHPKVSILMLTHDAPEAVAETIDGVATTILTRYELIVVDNASGPETRAVLEARRDKIDKLVYSNENLLYAAGNNRAFEESDPGAKYVLLLNSDVEILHPLWLSVLVEWAEWLPQTRVPPQSHDPVEPNPGPRDIVSFGWCPWPTRPDGWCCLIRREVYAKYRMNAEDFPWFYGLGDLVSRAMRNGARAGVLASFHPYVHHMGHRSPKPEGLSGCDPKLTKQQARWFDHLHIETLSFALHPIDDCVIRQAAELVEAGHSDTEIANRLDIKEVIVRRVRNGDHELNCYLVPGSGIQY